MPSPEILSAFSTLISFVSLFLVVVQLRDHNRQRKLESEIHIYDVNRELLKLGFDKPELFEILEDAQDADPVRVRRYLQLWLNQLALIYSMHQHGYFKNELEDSLVREVREFMKLKNMQRHWQKQRNFYPAPFRRFVDGVIQSLPEKK